MTGLLVEASALTKRYGTGAAVDRGAPSGWPWRGVLVSSVRTVPAKPPRRACLHDGRSWDRRPAGVANHVVLQTLAGPGDVIVSDRLNHASIVDGRRLSQALGVGPNARQTRAWPCFTRERSPGSMRVRGRTVSVVSPSDYGERTDRREGLAVSLQACVRLWSIGHWALMFLAVLQSRGFG
jgi:hypothetical protein